MAKKGVKRTPPGFVREKRKDMIIFKNLENSQSKYSIIVICYRNAREIDQRWYGVLRYAIP